MHKGKRNFFAIVLTLLVTLGLPKLQNNERADNVKAATSVTLYLKLNNNWPVDNARFAAYVWAPEAWYDLTLAEGETDIYQVTIPNNGQTGLIFTRMTPDSPLNNWDNKWNQTSDLELTFPMENNMYALNEGAWGNNGEVIGYWTNYIPPYIPPVSSEDPGSEGEDSSSEGIESSYYVLHYWRNDGKQNEYDLWLWGEGQNGKAYEFNTSDDYGITLRAHSTFFYGDKYLNLIIRTKGSWAKQTPDIQIDVEEYPLVAGERHFYLVDMETTVYKSATEAKGEKILGAKFTKTNTISVATYLEPDTFKVVVDELPIKEDSALATYKPAEYRWNFTITLDTVIDVTKLYNVKVTFKSGVVKEKLANLEGLFDDPFFVENLTYEGSDLGVTYTPSASTFKVWAPTTQDLKLRIYDNGTPVRVNRTKGSDEFVEHDFVRADKGVWSVSVPGDLHAKYYTLVATNSNGTNEFVDPYAKAAGVNGMRGMIVDFAKTNPTGWGDVNFSVKKPTEIVPYELHVSDLTADSTWNGSEWKRKNFLGLIEKGTMYERNGKAIKTGFDHIRELGINALQILPFYDQENDETNMEFNWGYNPKNYNVLEGGYSSDPYNGLVRIQEFKRVVQAYANEDIRIIMDVVYNHVASISQHSFTKLVPGYYFRFNLDGSPRNSSGVGNDTASERIMMERYMVDSTYFWATEYKLGGFRFDLMGLHTVDAMKSIMTKLKTYRNDIIVYGEPWNMESGDGMLSPKKPYAIQSNLYQVPGLGGFNDQMRDAIKGDSNDTSRGWVQMGASEIYDARLNKIKDGLMGKTTNGSSDPIQTVNYVSVHDNLTIYDKLYISGTKDALFGVEQIKKQAVQAEALSLLSQGIGFVHAGSEILRSKPLGNGRFDHNSYKSDYTINSIKWNEKYDNLDYHNFYRQMIALKVHAPAFSLNSRAAIDNGAVTLSAPNKTTIKLTYSASGDTYTIYHFGVMGSTTVSDISGQQVVFDSSKTLTPGSVINSNPRIPGNSTLITRNVRDRGPNDPTMPAILDYEPFVPPITEPDPYDDGTSSSESSSMPPSTSLPDSSDGTSPDVSAPSGGETSLPPTSEGEGTPSESDKTKKTIIIVASSVGGTAGVGAILFFVLRFLRKKP
ncbi:MAG: Pullulanase precursor [Tenericutes bacterium ADurb.Bin087]|nr:MAG: Pullulanase precursor [Tenericutes bacterium ADurb.Bin087]